jgi:hypothetical protein
MTLTSGIKALKAGTLTTILDLSWILKVPLKWSSRVLTLII